MNILTTEEVVNLEQVEKDGIKFYIWPNGGGLVKNPQNVDRNAQVFGNAQVSGDAQVFGNARVSGDARVSGANLQSGTVISCQSFIQLYGLGSHCLTAVKKDEAIFLTKGCWSGSVTEAIKKGKEVYDEKGQQLLAAMLTLVEKHFEIYANS